MRGAGDGGGDGGGWEGGGFPLRKLSLVERPALLVGLEQDELSSPDLKSSMRPATASDLFTRVSLAPGHCLTHKCPTYKWMDGLFLTHHRMQQHPQRLKTVSWVKSNTRLCSDLSEKK